MPARVTGRHAASPGRSSRGIVPRRLGVAAVGNANVELVCIAVLSKKDQLLERARGRGVDPNTEPVLAQASPSALVIDDHVDPDDGIGDEPANDDGVPMGDRREDETVRARRTAPAPAVGKDRVRDVPGRRRSDIEHVLGAAEPAKDEPAFVLDHVAEFERHTLEHLAAEDVVFFVEAGVERAQAAREFARSSVALVPGATEDRVQLRGCTLLAVAREEEEGAQALRLSRSDHIAP